MISNQAKEYILAKAHLLSYREDESNLMEINRINDWLKEVKEFVEN